jgi:hypothetical protein
MSQAATSEYRVEKQRADAELVLATGDAIRGCFFLWASSQTHEGPERIGDLLNAHDGFFPFELESGETALYNRAHIVMVRLPAAVLEAQMDPGYEVATRRHVSMLLSNGMRLAGRVSVYRPWGRDRLSDYARSDDAFRYLETSGGTIIVNSAHLVELREIGD